MLSIKNNLNNNNNNNNNNVFSPPWEVVVLVSYHLDPKTLAISSCVSKSWCTCFSSDYLWDPLCSSHFPFLSALQTTVHVPRRRLFAIGYASARLRNPLPRKPHLSVDNLIFAITIRIPIINNSKSDENSGVDPHQSSHSSKYASQILKSQSSHSVKLVDNNNNNNRGAHVVNIVRPCKELMRDPQGTFRFEVDVEDDGEWTVDELEGVRVTWNVADSNEWKAVFTMAEDSGAKKGGFSSCADGWFSEELPTPWCCSGAMSSGLVADLRVELAAAAVAGEGGGSNRRIKKVTVGVMCIINWRYLSLDDALSYLDHFLRV